MWCNSVAFQQYKIYCQETLLQQKNNQPNTNVLTFCAKMSKDKPLFWLEWQGCASRKSVVGKPKQIAERVLTPSALSWKTRCQRSG